MQVHKLKLEFVFFFRLSISKKAYLPTHSEKCGSAAAIKEFFILGLSPLNLEKIKHGIKTLAVCGGIRGVDNTMPSS
jgi:hypothetical protein